MAEPRKNSSQPKASGSKPLSLLDLVNKAKESAVQLTFNIADLETKVSSNGNVGMRVKLSSGQTVTFWASNMDDVVKAVDAANGIYGVVPGTRIATDGGLIPANASQGGFWKD